MRLESTAKKVINSYNTERGTEALGREGSRELGTDSARVTVGTGDFSVDGTGLGAVGLAGGAVDKGDTLTEVPLGFCGTVDALQLDDGGLGGLKVLTTLVSEVACLHVKTSGTISCLF